MKNFRFFTTICPVFSMALASGFITLFVVPPTAGQDQGSKPADELTLLKARASLAQKAYKLAFMSFLQSKKVENRLILTGTPEEVYTWSIRLLQAQRDLGAKHEDQMTALKGHFQRMIELDKKVKEMVKDLLPAKTAREAEWYRLEAELWLLREKTKQAKSK